MMKMNIQPVSALRDYNKLLSTVKPDSPVFLTKNGRGKYAIVDLDEYDRFINALKVLKDLKKAEEEDREYTLDEAFEGILDGKLSTKA